jgi:hypothetical protein
MFDITLLCCISLTKYKSEDKDTALAHSWHSAVWTTAAEFLVIYAEGSIALHFVQTEYTMDAIISCNKWVCCVASACACACASFEL